tara:strand:+ start:978 stop:1550 length:573 start_codon:yes stop_codon:yes gene_type:complete
VGDDLTRLADSIAALRRDVDRLDGKITAVDMKPPTHEDWRVTWDLVGAHEHSIKRLEATKAEHRELLYGGTDTINHGLRALVLGWEERFPQFLQAREDEEATIWKSIRSRADEIVQLRSRVSDAERKAADAARRVDSVERQIGRVEQSGEHGVRKRLPVYQRPAAVAAGAGGGAAALIEIARMVLDGIGG